MKVEYTTGEDGYPVPYLTQSQLEELKSKQINNLLSKNDNMTYKDAKSSADLFYDLEIKFGLMKINPHNP